MKFSISNIAWKESYDEEMYAFLSQIGFEGLEIAPTRIFGVNPYTKLNEAKEFSYFLKEKYNLIVPSMQSIWYGRNENIFVSKKERDALIEYTRYACEFANILGCNNLVFGCPRNRNCVIEDKQEIIQIEEEFFSKIADYAKENNCVIAIEANPPIYNTNYINNTHEAIQLIERIKHPNINLNLDLGTIIYNNETLEKINAWIKYINHVHISRPQLAPIELDKVDSVLIQMLETVNYQKFVSVEVAGKSELLTIKKLCEDLINKREQYYEKI